MKFTQNCKHSQKLNLKKISFERTIRYYIDLITILTVKELKIRYKNSFLGYLWSLLNPLAMALVFFFAFKKVLKIQIPHYTFFLICGLFPWQWFNNSVLIGTNVFIGNAPLIKKLNFPRCFTPLATVCNDLLHFIVSLPVILIFAFYYKIYPSLAWIYGIPLLISSQFFLTYGVSLFCSSLNLFFRDLERLINILIMLLFYATPVLYSLNLVPNNYKKWLFLNPMVPLIENWRNVFMKGNVDFYLYCLSLIYNILIFLVCFLVFKKLSYKFAEVL